MTLNTSLLVSNDVVISLNSNQLVPIIVSNSFLNCQRVLFTPKPFVGVPRELYVRIPSTHMYRDTSAIIFFNLCTSLMRLPKYEMVGFVECISP